MTVSEKNTSLTAVEQPGSPAPRSSKRIRAILADAYAFIRSAEANQAVAAITQEELISDHIKRNGESSASAKAKFDPYSYDPGKAQPEGETPPERVNFAGGTDTGRPTKMDRLLALKNELESAVDEVKKMEPIELEGAEAYTDAMTKSLPQ